MNRCAALLAAALLAGCGAMARAPRIAESPIQNQALAAETEGARRYARSDYVGARLSFNEAGRLYQSLDDTAGNSRSQVNAARAELAQGQATAALQRMASLEDMDTPGVDVHAVTAQAHLALGALPAAQTALDRALAACPADCRDLPTLRLLQARLLLAGNKPAEALPAIESALKALRDGDEPRELANAWRLLATARLALNDTAAARAAAQSALVLDRQLGLPEKIARDWRLLGDVELKSGAPADAAKAYRRSLGVTRAAGLDDLAQQTEADLKTLKGKSP